MTEIVKEKIHMVDLIIKLFDKLIKRYVNSYLMYGISFLCLLADWCMMKSELGIEYSNFIGTTAKAIGDIALILMPYWLLSPKWRESVIIPVWIIPIWCVCNLAYFRFWNDLIPPASITMGGNMDGNLFEYGFALLRWWDIFFLIPPIIASIALKHFRPALSPSFSLRQKGCLFCCSLIVGLAGQASYIKSTFTWRNEMSQRHLKEGIKEHYLGEYHAQDQLYEYTGPVFYGIRFVIDAINVINCSVELTTNQNKKIADFLQNYSKQICLPDSIKSNNEDFFRSDSMNVVYMIIESLNAEIVSKEIGDWKVMPILDSLAHSEGSVVFDNVVSQIKASSSSDGHLLLMTGLLPPDKISYSITYGSKNTFPSLADAFPYHNKYLLLADDGVCWNEGNTLKNFGLGEPLVIKDRPEYPIEQYGRDGAMFLQAIQMMNGVKHPFFMTLMTISMHIPFSEEAWPLPEILVKADSMTEAQKNYANVCHNTDKYIGEFLKSLPNNTLVIIASDHHQNAASDAGDARAFYMAVNCGRTERISRTVGQVNLFPATLDIINSNMSYRGVAPSAFNPCVVGTIDSYGKVYGSPTGDTLDSLQQAYNISDLIIRGDYFKGIY